MWTTKYIGRPFRRMNKQFLIGEDLFFINHYFLIFQLLPKFYLIYENLKLTTENMIKMWEVRLKYILFSIKLNFLIQKKIRYGYLFASTSSPYRYILGVFREKLRTCSMKRKTLYRYFDNSSVIWQKKIFFFFYISLLKIYNLPWTKVLSKYDVGLDNEKILNILILHFNSSDQVVWPRPQ